MVRTATTLTTSQLAASLGVSESSVKRWVDDGTIQADRTAGGHRRIPIGVAIEFIRQRASTDAKSRDLSPENLPLETAPELGGLGEDAVNLMADLLARDEATRVHAVLTGRYLCGHNLAELADNLILPSLTRVHERYGSDSQLDYLRRRAFDTIAPAIANLRNWIPAPTQPEANAPTVLVAGDPTCTDAIVPAIAGAVVATAGARSRTVGAQIAAATLAYGLEHTDARMCVICSESGDAQAAFDSVLEQADCEFIHVNVGVQAGQPTNRTDSISTMKELAQRVEQLVSSQSQSRNDVPAHS